MYTCMTWSESDLTSREPKHDWWPTHEVSDALAWFVAIVGGLPLDAELAASNEAAVALGAN